MQTDQAFEAFLDSEDALFHYTSSEVALGRILGNIALSTRSGKSQRTVSPMR
jgi:hypothetical protein